MTQSVTHACVIGWPIAHSRSPLIHGYWLRTLGMAGSYTKVAVEPQDLEAFLATLSDRGLAGCNVTVPHKEAAFAASRLRDPSAVAVGAANTLWLDRGELACANTDTYGFMTHLNARAPQWAAHDAPVAILGAGGAARAIVYGFLQAGVSDIWLFNRSRERAEAVAATFGPRIKVFDWGERETRARGAGVLVNTTSLGLKAAGELGIGFSGFSPACIVADIVYVPLETPFLAAARRAGLVTVDGLGMLLHQAVPGFERWFGVRPHVTAELRALIVADIEAA